MNITQYGRGLMFAAGLGLTLSAGATPESDHPVENEPVSAPVPAPAPAEDAGQMAGPLPDRSPVTTPPNTDTPAADSPEPQVQAGVRKPVTQAEREAYALGMMVARYTQDIMRDMQATGMQPDMVLVAAGIQDSLTGTPHMATADAQDVLRQLTQAQAEQESASVKALSDITRKSNVLERADGMVWVGKRRGSAVTDKTALVLTVSGRFHEGDIFEPVHEISTESQATLPVWLQQAVKLAGAGGRVELFAQAGRLTDGHRLPAGTSPWQIVRYTVSVEKG